MNKLSELHSKDSFFFFRDDGREILIIHTSCDIHDESTRGDMEKIREQLSDRLKKPKSDIKLEGIEEGSLVFLFSVSKLNIKDFFVLSFLRSLWLNGVLKVETNDFIIVPGNNDKFILLYKLENMLSSIIYIILHTSFQLQILKLHNK